MPKVLLGALAVCLKRESPDKSRSESRSHAGLSAHGTGIPPLYSDVISFREDVAALREDTRPFVSSSLDSVPSRTLLDVREPSVIHSAPRSSWTCICESALAAGALIALVSNGLGHLD